MRMPSSVQMKSLEKAAVTYGRSLTLATGYLSAKGIPDLDVVTGWRLGVVESPEPGHDQYVGRLAIPYLNRAGVVGFKFRCLSDHDCKEFGHEKFMALPGQPVFLYNVVACDSAADTIHVVEGEPDTWVLSLVFPGEPVVGCPGAGQWQPHWPAHFRGFDRVLLWPDGDKAGRNMADKWRKEIPSAEVVRLPAGFDVAELFVAEGADIFRRLAGVEE